MFVKGLEKLQNIPGNLAGHRLLKGCAQKRTKKTLISPSVDPKGLCKQIMSLTKSCNLPMEL